MGGHRDACPWPLVVLDFRRSPEHPAAFRAQRSKAGEQNSRQPAHAGMVQPASVDHDGHTRMLSSRLLPAAILAQAGSKF